MSKPKISRIRGITKLLSLVLVIIFCYPVWAGEYTPPGLYEVDHYLLPNGLRVVLKERHQARSVSFRVIVNVGMMDYPCGRKETPHFLEHLLFTGTSKHTESELDDLIEEHGGEWNATTSDEDTVYILDIFSKYADLGLNTLFEIISDSQVTQSNVDTSRDIIHRESGGRPSVFRQWLYEQGVGKYGAFHAYNKILEGTPYACEGLELADNITRDDVLAAYKQFYIPNNMTLVIVGDVDSTMVKARIKETFGTLLKGEEHHRPVIKLNPVEEGLLLTSTLSPILGSEAMVGVAYPSVGAMSPDYYAMWFIESYLSGRLYKKIRVEEGKSYAPSANSVNYRDVGAFFASADTDFDAMEEVTTMIQAEIDSLVDTPITTEDFSLARNKLLMGIVKGYESNGGIADYYVDSIGELERHGSLINEEEAINSLSVQGVQRVASKYFSNQPKIDFQNTPAITYNQLALIALVGLFILSYLLLRAIRAKR